MDEKKENILLNSVLRIFSEESKGRVLDFGAAQGSYSIELHDLGFDVTAIDLTNNFRFKDKIKFIQTKENEPLPFGNGTFDFVLLAEVIEHLRDPYVLFRDINRVLKKGGKLILSTPNILNLKSRVRFLSEGTFEYFRETPLDHVVHNLRTGIDVSQVHVMPWRYHEIEFMLKECGFSISGITTSIYEGLGLSFFVPLIRFQLNSKAKRSLKKGGIDYRRINKVLLSNELLFGRHLIIKAAKE